MMRSPAKQKTTGPEHGGAGFAKGGCDIFAGAFCCRAATDEIDPETKFFTPENAPAKPQVLCLSSA
jgi:hypothetical protein